jgi:hypothetical protein
MDRGDPEPGRFDQPRLANLAFAHLFSAAGRLVSMLDPSRAWDHRDRPDAIVLPDVERALRAAKRLPQLDHGDTSTT